MEKVKFGARTLGFMINDKEEEFAEQLISDEDLQVIDDKIGYTIDGVYIEDIVGTTQDEFCRIKR